MCRVDVIIEYLFIVFAYVVLSATWLIIDICIRYPILKVMSNLSLVDYY